MGTENFLQETIEHMVLCKKTPDDVSMVLDGDNKCTWGEFALMANFDHPENYWVDGEHHINDNLKILFFDGSWLDRECGEQWGDCGEIYEGWAFRQAPSIASIKAGPVKLKRLQENK